MDVVIEYVLKKLLEILPYVVIPLATFVFVTKIVYTYLVKPVSTEKLAWRPQIFIVFTSLQLLVASLVVANETMAISRQFPMTNFPIEHVASGARVSLFYGIALIAILLAWHFARNKRLSALLPSFKVVSTIAIFATLAGLFLFHYLAYLGFCCETPYAYFFGFPFSFLYGISGFDSSIQKLAHYGLYEILIVPKMSLIWSVRFYPLIMDILFWLNIAFTFYGLVNLFRGKGKPTASNVILKNDEIVMFRADNQTKENPAQQPAEG
jgi:hypothetical protein